MRLKDSAGILLLSVVLGIVLCACGGDSNSNPSPGVSVGYAPPFVPVTFSIDSQGVITVKTQAEIPTPIGTFSISANISASLTPADDVLDLIIRHKQQGKIVDTVYELKTGGADVRVVTNGKTVIEVSKNEVFIDASNGSIQSIEVKGTTKVTPVPTSAPVPTIAPAPTKGSVPILLPTAPPTPTPNPTKAPPTYYGQVDNTTVNQIADMNLRFYTTIVDGSCSGYFTVARVLMGNGKFTGNISGGNISFTVTPDDTTQISSLTFNGTISPDKASMNGTYIVRYGSSDYSQNGTWTVHL